LGIRVLLLNCQNWPFFIMSRRAKRHGGLSDLWNAVNTAWHIGDQSYFIGQNLNDWAPEYWERERNKRKRNDSDEEGKEIPPNETVAGPPLTGNKRKRGESTDIAPVDRTKDQGVPRLPERTAAPTDVPTVAIPNIGAKPSIKEMSKGGADAEVPIAAVPRAISKIHPDHFNIRLPFVRAMTFANSSAVFTNITPVCYIRLNSIYDVLKNSVTGVTYPVHYDGSTTTAGFADTVAELGLPIANQVTQAQTPAYDEDVGPQGRNIWQAHFKYYRVLQTHVKITFLNKNCDQVGQSYTGTEALSTISCSPGDVNVFRNSYACGFELIDEDGQVSNNCSMFLMTKNAERTILPSAELADISFSSSANAFCISKEPSVTTMTYAYNPNNWNYHVEQQGSSETRWTAVGANPSLDHLMAIRMFHMDSSGQNYTGHQNLGILVQIEYEVQFMECLDSFYKTQYYQASSDS
jgi:hypothetical protein